MKEFDVFIPIYYNDGTPIEPTKLLDLEERLLDTFEGLTVFPQPNKGIWKTGDVTYRDEIVIYRVLCSNTRSARRFFKNLKEELKEAFEQKRY